MNARRAVLVAMLATAALGAADPPEELATLRKQWETQRNTIEEVREQAVGKAVAAYEGELKALLANVRQRGDLDYVTAIQGELKRLETDRSAPAKPAAKRMEHLRKAQWGARQAEDKADKEREAKLAKLVAEHTARLEELEKRFVKENRIEDAKMVRGEREGVERNEICGDWLFVGKFPRTINRDGTITRFADEPTPDGSWQYLGERTYRIVTNKGERTNTATLLPDARVLEWVAADGKTYQATRR